MKREIKFRAKSAHCDAWCYGNLIVYEDEKWESEIVGFDVYREGRDEWLSEKIEYDTIGQFTGLYDKNGKEIYEGDIVNVVYNTNYKTQNYDSFIVCFGRWLYEDDEYADIPHNGWFLKHINEKPLQPKAVSMQHEIETPHTLIEVVGNIHEKQSEQ